MQLFPLRAPATSVQCSWFLEDEAPDTIGSLRIRWENVTRHTVGTTAGSSPSAAYHSFWDPLSIEGAYLLQVLVILEKYRPSCTQYSTA